MGPIHACVSIDQRVWRVSRMNIAEEYYFIKWLLGKYIFRFWHLSFLLLVISWILMWTSASHASMIAFECSLYLIPATLFWYSLKSLVKLCWIEYQKEKQALAEARVKYKRHINEKLWRR